jgi:hypothetical protein
MKTARKLGSTLELLARLSMPLASAACIVAPLATVATASVLLAGCADENDPQTWVKRLDDPAQRPAAIKRLSTFFEDTMTKANNDRNSPEVQSLIDKAAEPLTKVYTGVTLDEKTRRELIKLIADMRDPRTAPALAKAFNEYEPGKNDEDVKYASQSVTGMANAGKKLDQNLVDALWNTFSKFQVSKAKSINLVKDLHDAVLTVDDPSYGPKAVALLAAPVDPKNPDSVRDQLQFWQMTAIQVIGEEKFTGGIKPVVNVMITPEKQDLRATANAALMKMPKEAEPVLLAAFTGSDPDLARTAAAWGPDKTHLAILADSISWLSRPAGRDAILTALAQADNDANRTIMAQSLIRFHPDQKLTTAFLDAYKKIAPGTRVELLGKLFARPALAQASSHLYDASLTDWLLKETNAAKDADERAAMQVFALEAAVKLMTPKEQKAVGDAVTKYWAPKEQEIFKQAAAALDKCQMDNACYLALLDEPIPSSPPTANMRAVKAAWMLAMFGDIATRDALVVKIDKVKDGGARLAVVEAIDQLSPQGDIASADKLDKIVEADKASGNAALLAADDALVKVALRLRSRATP